MTLDQVPLGGKVKITAIESPSLVLQAMRLGVGPGAVVTVQRIMGGGPIIVRRQGGLFAVGRPLAQKMTVSFDCDQQ